LGKFWEGLAMEDVGRFYAHLVHFVAFWYILWPFGTFCGHLVHFVAIWYIFYALVFCTKTLLATLVTIRLVSAMLLRSEREAQEGLGRVVLGRLLRRAVRHSAENRPLLNGELCQSYIKKYFCDK
jgi:hypothetical protein